MIKCNKCGYLNTDDSKFCEACGILLAADQVRPTENRSGRTCKKCGELLEDDAAFCTNCGWKYEENTVRMNNTVNNGLTGTQTPTNTQINRPADKKPLDPKKSKSEKQKTNIVIPLIIGVTVLLIIAILVVFFLVIKPKVMDNTGNEDQQEWQSDLEDEYTDIAEDADTTEDAEVVEEEVPFDPALVTHAFIDTSMVNRQDYTRLTMNNIVLASCTSQYVQSGSTNGADMAVDGDEVTSWQEGVSGDGIGQGVSYQFDREYNVRYFTFKLGNWRSDKYYTGNNRPQSLTVTLDGRSFVFDFPASKQEFCIELSEDFPTTSVSVTINSVYAGTSWADTCIAEIGIYGR